MSGIMDLDALAGRCGIGHLSVGYPLSNAEVLALIERVKTSEAEVERMREGGGCDACHVEMASLDAEVEALRACCAAHQEDVDGWVDEQARLIYERDAAAADRDRAVREALTNAVNLVGRMPRYSMDGTESDPVTVIRSLIPEGDTA